AKMCVSQGLTLVYMQPSDVDIEKGIINGKVFVNNQWEGITTDIPKFIDISPYCFKRKNREVIQYLNEKTQLSDARVTNFGKAKLQRFLKKSDGFKHLVIPTTRAKSLKNVEEYVGRHESIVMKPLGGEQGKGVYILKKKMDGDYLLGYQKE